MTAPGKKHLVQEDLLATNRNTYEKHRREMEKKRKAADKRKRKESKKTAPPTPAVDIDAEDSEAVIRSESDA